MKKNLLLIILIVFSGLATAFYRSREATILLFVISAIAAFNWNVRFKKDYFIACFVWLVYALFISIKFDTIYPFFIFRHLAFITIAYVVINIYRDSFFYKFERIIYFFSLISLFFYCWQTVAPGSLIAIMKMADISQSPFSNRPDYYNFIFITVDYYPDFLFQRNSGFCWEPGPFSIYVVFAMLFNLSRNNFNMMNNKTFWIFLVTLITTQSTTGLAAFILMFLIIQFNKKLGAYKYVIFPVILIIVALIWVKVDILSSKVMELYIQSFELEEIMMSSAERGAEHSAGRFGGFIIAWNDLINNPLLGLGGNIEGSFGRQNYAKLYIVSGLGTIMSAYGLFGIVVYLYFTFKTSSFFSAYMNLKSKWLFFWMAFICSFAFSIQVQVILFTLLFFSFYNNRFQHKTYVDFLNVYETKTPKNVRKPR